MAGHQLTANGGLAIGYSGGSGTIIDNGGSFSTPNLGVYSSNSLVLGAGDTVTSTQGIYNSSQATTTAAGNVTGNVSLFSGSTLTLGASMTLSGQIDVRDSSTTLNMAGYPLSANTVYLGWYDGQPVNVLNRGPITATSLYVAAQTFNLNPSDTVSGFALSNGTTTLYSPVSGLGLSNSSQATTTAAGNVTGNVSLFSGSTLTLGASMTLSGQIDVERLLDDTEHGRLPALRQHGLFGVVRWAGGHTAQPRPITATSLYVAAQTFNLNPSDTVSGFALSNGTTTLYSPVSGLGLSNSSQATTTAAGNVTGNVSLFSGSTLTLGASMTLSGQIDVRDSSTTLNMAGYALSAPTIYLGWNDAQTVTLLNRGPIKATGLAVYAGGQTFNLNPSDTVTNFSVSNGTTTLNSPVYYLGVSNSSLTTTTAAGNVSGGVSVDTGGTLILGASMTLSNQIDVERNSTLNMAGYALSAPTIYLGWNQVQTVTLLNRGPITATGLAVYAGGQTFNLNPSDTVTNFSVSNGTTTLNSPVYYLGVSNSSLTTTTAAGNVSGGVSVDTGGTLTLGASMTLSNQIDVERNSTLNMAGYALSAPTIYLGWNQAQAVTLLNRGPITATGLVVYAGGQTFNLNPSDTVTNFLLSYGTTALNNPLSILNIYNSSQAMLNSPVSSLGVFNGRNRSCTPKCYHR